MTWIHDLPHWLFAILTLSTFVGAAVGGLILARRWGRQRGLHALVDNGVTGWIFSAILTVYAIAIGLIAVAAWSNASQASSVASHEAAAIAALYRDLAGYPDATRGDLQRTLARYTRFVIDEAWPAQRRGTLRWVDATFSTSSNTPSSASTRRTTGSGFYTAKPCARSTP